MNTNHLTHRRCHPVAGLRIALLVFAAVAAAPSAWAQTLEAPRPRQGYYVSGGAGLLQISSEDKGEGRGPWFGDLITLRAGQLVTERFGLGLVIEAGGAKHKGFEAQLAALALDTSFALSGNLALRGIAGFGVLGLRYPRDPDYGVRGTSGGFYALALAYDWFPRKDLYSGGWALTPVVEMRVLPGTTVDGLVGSVGIELTWWSGLPRDQLRLRGDEPWTKAKQ